MRSWVQFPSKTIPIDNIQMFYLLDPTISIKLASFKHIQHVFDIQVKLYPKTSRQSITSTPEHQQRQRNRGEKKKREVDDDGD